MASKKAPSANPAHVTEAPAQPADNGGWEEVLITSMIDVGKLEEGSPPIEAIYLGSVEKVSAFGPVKLHVFYNRGDGEALGLWGSMALDEGMSRCTVGRETRIEMRGWLTLEAGKRMRKVKVCQRGAVISSGIPMLEQAREALGVDAIGLMDELRREGEYVNPETGEVTPRILTDADLAGEA